MTSSPTFQQLVDLATCKKVGPIEIPGGMCFGYNTVCKFIMRSAHACKRYGELDMTKDGTPIKASYCQTACGIKRRQQDKF